MSSKEHAAVDPKLVERLSTRTSILESQLGRLDKIEEDVATLAGHIAGIKATLAEIAAGQQAQAQAQQAASLADRVDATEQATGAIRATMTAHDDRVRQVSASVGELRLATRDKTAEIIMRLRG